MKRIFLILFILCLALVGCSSAPEVLPFAPNGESLDGVWMREDGAYFTFRGNEWEVVDLVNGAAGFGTFKFSKWKKQDVISFIYTDIANLKINQEPWTKYKRGKDGNVTVKNFQMRAQEEYLRLHPEIIPVDFSEEESTNAWGGGDCYYTLEGDVLSLNKVYPPSKGQNYASLPFYGIYVKQ